MSEYRYTVRREWSKLSLGEVTCLEKFQTVPRLKPSLLKGLFFFLWVFFLLQAFSLKTQGYLPFSKS